MNDHALIGIVSTVVIIALVFLYRSRRSVQQRCPACHSFGRGEHYGRYRCSGCGANFVLDATGKAKRSVWEVVHAPLSILLLVVAFLTVGFITRADVLREQISGVVLISAIAGWELSRAFKTKTFKHQDHAT